MKTVKPISAQATEHTVTFAFSAFLVTLCVLSLAGIPKLGLLTSGIKNNPQISKPEIIRNVYPSTTNTLKTKKY